MEIMCTRGIHSKLIYDTYYKNHEKVKMSDKHMMNYLLTEEQITETPTSFLAPHLNLTRKIQLIAGFMILLIFFITIKFKFEAIFAFVGLGLMMIYVGLSGNCFMSKFLIDY